MSAYDYPISTTFPSGLRTDILQAEILASSIAQYYVRIDTAGNICTVVCSAELSQQEKAALDAVVAAHNPGGEGELVTYRYKHQGICDGCLHGMVSSRANVVQAQTQTVVDIQAPAIVKPTLDNVMMVRGFVFDCEV